MDNDNEKNESEENQEQVEDSVSLSSETYNALLDKLDLLETTLANKKDNVDTLAKEGVAEPKTTTQDNVDLDDMTREELVRHIRSDFESSYVNPIALKLEEVRVSNEIDRLIRKPGYEDFLDYSEEILATAKENPNLSLDRIYRLVKEDRQERETKTLKSDERLARHLPRRFTGEKPSVPASSMSTAKEPKTLKDAASIAYDEVMKNK